MTKLSPEVTRSVTAVARGLVAAARAAALYPAEHPAVQAAVSRLQQALAEVTAPGPYGLGVAPDTLLIDGSLAAPPEGPVAEAAALLHDRGVLRLVFAGGIPTPALVAFLRLLATDAHDLRARGGPAHVWSTIGHPAIAIEQIDYEKVLADRDGAPPPHERKDDVWHSLVRSIVDKRKQLDEAAQRRLLEIAGSVDGIGELAADVMAPGFSLDGSPMITTQAAAVFAAYQHLSSIVTVMAPEQLEQTMSNIAAATARLDPHVAMQMLRGEDEGGGGGALVKGIAAAFDDMKVAQLLATTLALEGQASNRLAEVFDTIAPDDERKRRVLGLTRALLNESDFARNDQFESLWTSMQELLLTYNDRPFVSASYQAALDGVGERAQHMAAVDLPPELPEWLESLDQENVRRLSVTLLIDLLGLEENAARAAELTSDMGGLAEDLLMAGDYAGAGEVAQALARAAANPTGLGRDSARTTLDRLGGSVALREAVALFDEMEDAAHGDVAAFCRHIGPAAVDALQAGLAVEAETRAVRRAMDLIAEYGVKAVSRLGPLAAHGQWYAQRHAAHLLGRLGAAEAVPLLQALLRSRDERVFSEAVRALTLIDDPAAARAVHSVLRAATGGQSRRAVVDTLVAQRDPRVVPVLVRILSESQPLGSDHPIVLETLEAVGRIPDDRSVPVVAGLLRHHSWFARAKTRALREAALGTLARLGAPGAAAVREAAAGGDRMTRKMAKPLVTGLSA